MVLCETFCQNKRCLMNIMVNGIRIRISIGGVKTEKVLRVPRAFSGVLDKMWLSTSDIYLHDSHFIQGHDWNTSLKMVLILFYYHVLSVCFVLFPSGLSPAYAMMTWKEEKCFPWKMQPGKDMVWWTVILQK